MDRQDLVRTTLEDDSRIIEVQVEYRRGKRATYTLAPGKIRNRQAAIDQLVEEVKWDKVGEVEIVFADGKKYEIDLEGQSKPRAKKAAATTAAEGTAKVASVKTVSAGGGAKGAGGKAEMAGGGVQGASGKAVPTASASGVTVVSPTAVAAVIEPPEFIATSPASARPDCRRPSQRSKTKRRTCKRKRASKRARISGRRHSSV